MNERIQELMVELKKTVSTHRGDAVLIGYDEIEKFAELIVRECGNYMNSRIPGNIEVSATVAKMKKHFGVE